MATSLSNKISTLQQAINVSLLDALTKPPTETVFNQIATVIPTTAKITALPVGLPIADLTEQTAESMTLSGVDTDSISVKSKDFYSGFKISFNEFNDNSTTAIIDLYSWKLKDLTNKAVKFYDKLIIDYLVSNPTTWTTEALFANSQTWGRGATAQDNLLGLALDATGLKTAIATIKTFKDHLGQPIAQSGRLKLLVPPALEYTAKELVQSTTTYGGQNVLTGVADVVVSEYLSDADDWYLTMGSDQLLIVERQAPEVKIVENEEMETILIKMKVRAAPAVGMWTSFVKSVQ